MYLWQIYTYTIKRTSKGFYSPGARNPWLGSDQPCSFCFVLVFFHIIIRIGHFLIIGMMNFTSSFIISFTLPLPNLYQQWRFYTCLNGIA
ncbi:hypothetical protein Anas_06794 [Armadillidium nasatum]|uniref:Uncharacterized protein n=1 Tax=Armadillidium nasatum TaxID=96803 RepID=A0A5N5TMP1_9CRUS|nr:hypothetical protein Anas_06794 [Armadillidium nasatum]